MPAQIAYPLRINQATGLDLCEQHTDQDVRGTADAVLHTPLGHHDSLPDLGTPDLVGVDLEPDDLAELTREIVTRHDPRATVLTREETTDMLHAVQAEVTAP